MNITLVGHGTVLIESDGQKIITDPYFGLWGNLVYKRLSHPAKSREKYVDVTLVLLSHNHWDHTDRTYFRLLSETIPVFTPKRAVWMTKLKGARNVTGIKTWESLQSGKIKITAVPAIHASLASGFIIEIEGKQLYFTGDTYYNPSMKRIGKRFQLDVASMPVTTFRIPPTMGERSAVWAVRDLDPKTIIPIHRGIVPRSPFLRTKQTPEKFENRLRAAGLENKVVILKDGETWNYT
jgi:L-ascorbate metabolism protein UlaG (beta-lactamase superfamily)